MFHGFSQETVDFMWGIRFNNEKSWFELHKADYQTYFLTPMKDLGAQVQSALLDRFPQSGLNLKISRIYRDARRLFGRRPSGALVRAGPRRLELRYGLLGRSGGGDGKAPGPD